MAWAMRVWVLVGWLHWEYELRGGPGLCGGELKRKRWVRGPKTAMVVVKGGTEEEHVLVN
jgi:hypothetical protein